MKSRLFLDKRHLDKEGKATLKIVITKRGTIGMISLFKIKSDQWENGVVKDHPDAKLLNSIIKIRVGEVERLMLELSPKGVFVGKTGTEICNIIRAHLDPEQNNVVEKKENDFLSYFKEFIKSKDNKGTIQLYNDTIKKLESFCKEKSFPSPSFEDINRSWLNSFEKYCLQTQKQNTASRHLRDIRAVFNGAIDDGLTTNYPFRKFKIKKEETKDKHYSSKELRSLFEYKCYEGWQQEAVDIFLLMFCLIGINSIDLAYTNDSDVQKGRLNYTRSKTHKPYSIKLEPEAEAIINKYKGKDGRLLNILERVPNYKTYYNRLGKTLRKVGLTRVKGMKSSGRALLPEICIGSARTSWATIAQEELDIPREVVAAALGHHTVDVTSTYIRADWRKKVDAANRKVINWVLYHKK